MPGFSLDDIIKFFFTCNREELFRIFKEILNTIKAGDKIATYEGMPRNYEPAHFTLECSRPALGPYSVMASLDGIGLLGYQRPGSHSLELVSYAKGKIDMPDYCRVLNSKCHGPTVVWQVLPRGR
ncbi:MAG: hypothetical protein MUC95_05625, partial [Spirochaetes bacterium]|nr:hypothetical protein [Spirochaetota bacterium]